MFVASAFPAGGATARRVAAVSTPPAPRVDLRVAHTGAATIAPGSDSVWTTTVTNDGPAPAVEVTVSRFFAGPLTLVSASAPPSFSCVTAAVTANRTAIECNGGTIAVGESVTFTFTGRASLAPAGTPVSASASASSPLPDPVPTNNHAAAFGVIGVGADVRISKTAPRRGTFEIVVTNDGPATALGVVMTDQLPWQTTDVQSFTQIGGPPFTCTPFPSSGEPTSITCTATSLDPGASATFAVLVDIPPGSVLPIRNQASLSATNDANGSNNTAAASMDPALTIPTLSPSLLVLLAAALSAVAMTIVRRV